MVLVLCSASCEAFFSVFSNLLFSFFLLQNDRYAFKCNCLHFIVYTIVPHNLVWSTCETKINFVLINWFTTASVKITHMGILFPWSHKRTIFAMGKCFSFLIIFDISDPSNFFIFTFLKLFFNSLICLSWESWM